MTLEEEYQQLCHEWQKTLRLQDWDIVVRVCTHWGMSTNCQGEVDWVVEKKKAIVRLLDPAHCQPNKAFPQDLEKTLVHELLHLHFASYAADDGTAEDIAQEQTIDILACAMVQLKRTQS